MSIVKKDPEVTKKLLKDKKERQKNLDPKFCRYCGHQFDVDRLKRYNKDTGEQEPDFWVYCARCNNCSVWSG